MLRNYFLKNTGEPDQVSKVLETAQAWLGYVPVAGGKSEFGERVGHDGRIWNGSFIDVVFFDSGLVIPSCVQTGQGLAEFIRAGRVVKDPQPGDIMFMTVTGDDSFGMPHIGLVLDTTRFKTDGLVQTIEACVSSGLPKSDPGVRGVFKRVRTVHDVLAFCRPAYSPIIETGGPEIKLDSVRPGRRNKHIGLVQLALKKETGLVGETVDMFDGRTQEAYAHWQRILGYVNRATGVPDLASLKKLGERTGAFSISS